jgi:hypothetical protein
MSRLLHVSAITGDTIFTPSFVEIDKLFLKNIKVQVDLTYLHVTF